jgi:hypothetical protein
LPVSAPSELTNGPLVAKLPELFRPGFRQRVLDLQAAAQPHDVRGAVAALHALPARIARPVLLQGLDFLLSIHGVLRI